MVMSCLISSMTTKIGEIFLFYSIAREIWEAVRKTFHRWEYLRIILGKKCAPGPPSLFPVYEKPSLRFVGKKVEEKSCWDNPGHCQLPKLWPLWLTVCCQHRKMPRFRLMLPVILLNIWMRTSLAGGDLGVITVENYVILRILAGNSMENPWTGSLIRDLLSMKAMGIQPQLKPLLHHFKPPSLKINSRSLRGWLVKQTFYLILLLLVLKVLLTEVIYTLFFVQPRHSQMHGLLTLERRITWLKIDHCYHHLARAKVLSQSV